MTQSKVRKVLFYINTISTGGAERVLVQLTKHFSKAGWETVLVTSYPSENEYTVCAEVKRVSLEPEELKQSRLQRNISRIRKLRRICKSEKPNVMISFMQEPNFRAVLAAAGLPVKTIVSVRNDPNREYAGVLGKLTGKLILPMADGCVFQTEEAKAWFPKRLQKKSAIIQNEVSEDFFKTQRNSAHDIVTVGRLCEQKNHRLLINAFAEIAQKHPDEKLLIYGSGAQDKLLREQIEALRMNDRVLLMGSTNDVPEVLSRSKVFALSSDYEGMPNCLLEALAVGVPSVATDCPCGGPRTVIQDGENGLLVPVGDETAMAKALDKLLSDPEYAERIGQNGKNSAMRFKPDVVFAQWRDFAQSVIDEEV